MKFVWIWSSSEPDEFDSKYGRMMKDSWSFIIVNIA